MCGEGDMKNVIHFIFALKNAAMAGRITNIAFFMAKHKETSVLEDQMLYSGSTSETHL